MEKEVVISAIIEARLREELRALAKRNDRSFSAELRIALREHVLKHLTPEEAK